MNVSTPVRATRTYTQRMKASASRVFPLLCPVREVDWAVGWAPELVASQSGLAENECVFTTPAGERTAIWMVTRHEPVNGFVEMIRIVPEVTACRLSIQLTDVETGSEARVTYSHTSLGPQGDAFVAAFTEAQYERFMQGWETEINHYLTTGRRLDPDVQA